MTLMTTDEAVIALCYDEVQVAEQMAAAAMRLKAVPLPAAPTTSAVVAEAAASAATTGHTGTQAGPAGSAPSASFGPAAAKGQECVQTGISIRVTLPRLRAIFCYDFGSGPNWSLLPQRLLAT